MSDNTIIEKQSETVDANIQKSSEPNYYVGLGASAGGLEALTSLFTALPPDLGAVYIVVQHLSPNFKSVMPEILSRHTHMPVSHATNGQRAARNTVYVIPPGQNLMITEGKFVLFEQIPGQHPQNVIDTFFRALAHDQRSRSVAIILSGTGSDGTEGIEAIHKAGGHIIIQDPQSCKFDGMPENAIRTGLSDHVGTPTAIAIYLTQHTAEAPVMKEACLTTEQLTQHPTALKIILELIQSQTEIDFTSYKQSTILRRIGRRMAELNIGDIRSYQQTIEKDTDELKTLSAQILIGVTEFFRDPQYYDLLAKTVIPQLLEKAITSGSLRVWIAGCSTGEEAYSMAILIDEALAKRPNKIHLKMFVTDIDPDALAEASKGEFSAAALEPLSETRRLTYFNEKADRYVICSRLRQNMVFARHNLLTDPYFSSADLILCRNVLIYFQRAAQTQVLKQFLLSLRHGGFLFLGTAESSGEMDKFLTPVAPAMPIYQKCAEVPLDRQWLHQQQALGFTVKPKAPVEPLTEKPNKALIRPVHSDKLVLELITNMMQPSILLNHKFQVLHLLGETDIFTRPITPGRLQGTIHEIVDEQLKLPALNILTEAREHQTTACCEQVPLKKPGVNALVTLRAIFIEHHGAKDPYLGLTFEYHETTQQKDNDINSTPYSFNDQSHKRISDLERKVDYYAECLELTTQELETTNEALQSSNEELMASNEELQSTNEELLSVNEELFTINTQFEEKIAELSRTNNDLDHILKATQIGFIFLNSKLEILTYTDTAKRDFVLTPLDLNNPIETITHHLELPFLKQDIESVVLQGRAREIESINSITRKNVLVKLSPYFNEEKVVDGCVISVSDISKTKTLEMKLHESYQELRATIDSVLIRHKQQIRILIVDDEAVDREFIRRAIQKIKKPHSHYEIIEATTAEEAKKILTKNETIDVCLMDHLLNGTNSLKLIRSLPQKETLPAFIVISSLMTDEIFEEAVSLGVYDAIAKEIITPELLERSIRYTIRHRETEQYLTTRATQSDTHIQH